MQLVKIKTMEKIIIPLYYHLILKKMLKKIISACKLKFKHSNRKLLLIKLLINIKQNLKKITNYLGKLQRSKKKPRKNMYLQLLLICLYI